MSFRDQFTGSSPAWNQSTCVKHAQTEPHHIFSPCSTAQHSVCLDPSPIPLRQNYKPLHTCLDTDELEQ